VVHSPYDTKVLTRQNILTVGHVLAAGQVLFAFPLTENSVPGGPSLGLKVRGHPGFSTRLESSAPSASLMALPVTTSQLPSTAANSRTAAQRASVHRTQEVVITEALLPIPLKCGLEVALGNESLTYGAAAPP
jgi:hypothetical protein